MLNKYLASCLFKKRNRQEKKHRERGDESRRWRVWETSRPDKQRERDVQWEGGICRHIDPPPSAAGCGPRV